MAIDPQAARSRLCVDLPEVDEVFAEAIAKAERLLSPGGAEAWLEGAARVCRLKQGGGPVATFLDALPDAAQATDESILLPAAETALYLGAVPEVARLADPFLATLPAIARRVETAAGLFTWFGLVKRMAQLARPGLAPLLAHAPGLLSLVGIRGLANWIEFGVTNYRDQPNTVQLYFALQTADAHAAFQRERHGTLLVDHERELKLTMRSFWGLDVELVPYTLAFDTLRRPMPHLDKLGFHLPDVLEDEAGVAAIDRYRATLAHLAAHKLWSTPFTADNYSQLQHIFIEVFEDSRVEFLAMDRYPGLRRAWLKLHPAPRPGSVPEGFNSIRHHAAMLSRAILDPGHVYDDPLVLEFVDRFLAAMARDPYDREACAELGVEYLARVRKPDFREPKVWFEDTIVGYRDDNRYVWKFLEDTDSKDDFHSDHGTEDPPGDDGLMLPRHYPEWDYQEREQRPDWATVYESLPPAGDPGLVDSLLDRNAVVAKQIKRVIDRLKPQNRKRIRRQADGDEMDLDQVLTATIDLRAGLTPDPRIYQSHVPDGRDIAVLLLLDLSQSINDKLPGSDRGLLSLSQEAATLLAWAVGQLGDSFAVAGFASKSRHQVRYTHFKDFDEPWGPVAKGRLAAMEAGLATRMGAALRHAGHHLDQRREEKKLLLLVSDGEPADIDVDDDDYLKWDTHAAVGELRGRGINTFCITLDAKADAYIADIFGESGFTVVDQVARLPEKLTRMFLSLTK